MLNRTKLYAVVLLIAVFAAGIAIGAGVSAAASERGGHGDGSQPRRQEGYADRLERELQLTTAQRDTVDHILNRYQDSMNIVWHAMRPRMDSIRAAVRFDIMNALDSTQQAAYRDFIHRTDSARTSRSREGRHDRR
jgi:Spy/CpxP family protein refolding chaperone